MLPRNVQSHPVETALPDEETEGRSSRLPFLLEIFLRPAATGLVAWLAFQVPFPLLDDWLPLKNVLGVVVAITLAGKTLFDTLFFPRHPW